MAKTQVVKRSKKINHMSDSELKEVMGQLSWKHEQNSIYYRHLEDERKRRQLV